MSDGMERAFRAEDAMRSAESRRDDERAATVVLGLGTVCLGLAAYGTVSLVTGQWSPDFTERTFTAAMFAVGLLLFTISVVEKLKS